MSRFTEKMYRNARTVSTPVVVDRTAGYLGPSPATVGPEYLILRPATRGGDLLLPHGIGIHGLILLAVPAVLLARTAMAPARPNPGRTPDLSSQSNARSTEVSR